MWMSQLKKKTDVEMNESGKLYRYFPASYSYSIWRAILQLHAFAFAYSQTNK